MKRAILFALRFLLTLVLFGCSIGVSQPTMTIANSTATPDPLTPPAITTAIPITWAGLNLTGRLVYANLPVGGDVFSISVRILDLATGEIETLFSTTRDGWISYITVSPDAKQLVMSYIPPSEGSNSLNRALYSLPLDGSTPPHLLFQPPTPDDHYVHAEWSPDGKYLYYAHYNSNIRPSGQLDPTYNIFRIRFPGDQPEKIAEPAFWPRISADSTEVVYVSIDPISGRSDLYVANADGGNPQKVALSGSSVPEIIDAPIFSPDGQSILFSAPPPQQAYQPNFFDKLLGVRVAKAHDVPSDWWSVPLAGGVPSRLTQLQTINLFASFSPDKKHIASVSGEGIFVMDQEGSNLTQLLFDPGVIGTVSWIP